MLDERGLVRDEILKRIPKGSAAIYYHIIAWTLFIIYEVSLSGAILGSYNHFSDYLFHYPLYIILFYVNCYLVLGTKPFKNIADYSKLLAYLLLEFVCYYGCNMVINTYLESSGWPVTVIEPASRRFNLGTLYRFIYIVGLSSAFRTAINLLKSQKRNLEFVTETLTREKETEKLRNELLSTELSYLRARVEPHFLFGTLTSLHHRVRKKDAQTAEYVLALADLMRYSLQTTAPSDMVPVEMELEHINNYMDLQQMRFHTDIDFRITADDKELEIIPRLLNSLIENVFSHGDVYHPKSRTLVEITVSNGELVLRTSNYIRPDDRPGHGIGLANTRERLEGHYKDRYSLEYGANLDIFNLKLVIKLR